MAGGQLEILQAVRAYQKTDTVLKAHPIVMGRIPRADALPAIVNRIMSGVGTKGLGTTARDKFRTYRIEMKVVAVEGGGKEALENAQPLLDANYALFTSGSVKAGLNAYLAGLGWTALTPLEVADIPAYPDYIDDIERWHIGHLFDLRLQVL